MKKKIESKQLSDREVYLNNRNSMQADFDAYLVEIQKPTPSVNGVIAGMDFKQFSAAALFRMILEQEEYIVYAEEYQPEYVDIKEEKQILKNMIERAKDIYTKLYGKGMFNKTILQYRKENAD